jgi:hypothetical protein
MRRHEFISLLSGVILARPCGVMAQVTTKRRLIAVLQVPSPTAAARYLSGFLQEVNYG